MSDDQPCAGFPDQCPNIQPVPAALPNHGGGIRCGCGEPPVDDSPEPDRAELLADQLSREYDFRGIAELEQEDPERAQEHRDAAQALLPWITECPREERRAAFGRGYEKGRERQAARTAGDVRRLEAEAAELRQERDPDGLRARIRDLEHALDGWDRFMTGRTRPGAAPDWQAQAAEYLAQLTAAQRELAVLKGHQPADATRHAVPWGGTAADCPHCPPSDRPSLCPGHPAE